jgi:hypothetical protein
MVAAGEVEREAQDAEYEAHDRPDLGRVELDRADREDHGVPVLGVGLRIGLYPNVGAEDD